MGINATLNAFSLRCLNLFIVLDNTVTMYVYIACQQIVAANEWGIFENVLIDILGRI